MKSVQWSQLLVAVTLLSRSAAFAADTPPADFQNEVYDSIRSANLEALETATGSPCIADYRHLRNRYATLAGIAPFVGIAGLADSVVLSFGYEYGGWTALHAVLGAAGWAIFSYVVPVGVVAAYVSYESYEVARFVQAERSYRLIRDVYHLGNGKALSRFTAHIQKTQPDWTEDRLRAELRAFDESGSLCDGSRVHGFRAAKNEKQRKRLSHQVAWIHDLQKELKP